MLFLQVRREARHFSRSLINRLRVEPIKTFATYSGWALKVDNILIEVTTRRFRILDGIHVWHQGAEIWLPLFQRIKLRSTIRLLVTQRGNDEE